MFCCNDFLDATIRDLIFDNEDGTYDLSRDIYSQCRGYETTEYDRINYCPFCGEKIKC